MNLTSSKDFRKLLTGKSDSEYRRLRENFDNFLEKPLKLGYFIPCDENDVPLEEPKRWNDYLEFPESFDGNKEWYELYAYQEAKKRVLFEGFIKEGDFINNNELNVNIWIYDLNKINMQHLITCNLTLTETAKKEIGL